MTLGTKTIQNAWRYGGVVLTGSCSICIINSKMLFVQRSRGVGSDHRPFEGV